MTMMSAAHSGRTSWYSSSLIAYPSSAGRRRRLRLLTLLLLMNDAAFSALFRRKRFLLRLVLRRRKKGGRVWGGPAIKKRGEKQGGQEAWAGTPKWLVRYLVGSPDADAEVNAASAPRLPVDELPSSGSNLWPLRERDRASAGTET